MGLEDVIKERMEQADEEKEIDLRAIDYAEEILSITHDGLQSLEEVMGSVARGWLPMSTLTTITNSMHCRLERAREKFEVDEDAMTPPEFF